ncbi:hypothetical protein NW768_009309 [Fusarium equiseti]|uniref:asparaginase n=1 Tax=Fusarium equiseti TaxID=61235 RepID=A0ABQ8R3I7_FUSEQ|nr:hypothetical protein NW768_009309 [Fusarium equiseti]
MRPNSALSADGPFNFYDAVQTAVHPEARGRSYDRSERSSCFGILRYQDQWQYRFDFCDTRSEPYFFYSPALPKARNCSDAFTLASPLPKVDVLYHYQGFGADLLYAAAQDGARGIVIMGAGPDALSDAAIKAAKDLHSQGVVTVVSFRPYFGPAVPTPPDGEDVGKKA